MVDIIYVGAHLRVRPVGSSLFGGTHMKALTKRNLKELLRDPLSFIFCLGFPLVMLILMSILNTAIPKEAGMSVFALEQLLPGIAVFSFTFCMLFGALTVSRDRTGALLWRLRAAPLAPKDYVIGYLLPLMLTALGQGLVCILAGQVIAGVSGEFLTVSGLIRCFFALLPSMVMFVSLGILFGTVFSDKAAPGICSILISASSVLSGVWMDVEALSGIMEKICLALPFYHCVRAGRMGYAGDGNVWTEIIITAICAVFACIGAVLALRRQLRKEG